MLLRIRLKGAGDYTILKTTTGMRNAMNMESLSALNEALKRIRLAHESGASELILAKVDMENGTVKKGQNLLEDFVWPIDTGRLMGDPIDCID